jgi:hypothetical protein
LCADYQRSATLPPCIPANALIAGSKRIITTISVLITTRIILVGFRTFWALNFVALDVVHIVAMLAYPVFEVVTRRSTVCIVQREYDHPGVVSIGIAGSSLPTHGKDPPLALIGSTFYVRPKDGPP